MTEAPRWNCGRPRTPHARQSWVGLHSLRETKSGVPPCGSLRVFLRFSPELRFTELLRRITQGTGAQGRPAALTRVPAVRALSTGALSVNPGLFLNQPCKLTLQAPAKFNASPPRSCDIIKPVFRELENEISKAEFYGCSSVSGCNDCLSPGVSRTYSRRRHRFHGRIDARRHPLVEEHRHRN